MTFQVFVGYDGREAAAYRVCVASMRAGASAPVEIAPILEPHVRAMGLYRRRHERRDGRLWDVLSEAPMSTEFALTRFLVPQLASAEWAVFCDCDFLWRADIHALAALADPRYAVQVVPHAQQVDGGLKMDGQLQLAYRRKNWSSLVLWNCRHPAHQALPRLLDAWPGRRLHAFDWLADDAIGVLPGGWNWLEGHASREVEPLAVHYTRGTPDMAGYEAVPYADEWWRVLAAADAPPEFAAAPPSPSTVPPWPAGDVDPRPSLFAPTCTGPVAVVPRRVARPAGAEGFVSRV